jgi:hypothetical protein
MEISCRVPEKRTWIFFFLILLAGLLWASFLMIRGQMPEMSVLLALISVFISLFLFSTVPGTGHGSSSISLSL